MKSEPEKPEPSGKRAQPTRKIRESAALLPLLGIFLLLTPLISAFTQDSFTGGIPKAVSYIFGIWIGLIVLAAILARRLYNSGDG
ncbi:MAG: hypothetical protein GY952_07355 [Rhodobacteraceae bacterium]|nr:hypothetical protein [Paracoccaceae bacterium]